MQVSGEAGGYRGGGGGGGGGNCAALGRAGLLSGSSAPLRLLSARCRRALGWLELGPGAFGRCGSFRRVAGCPCAGDQFRGIAQRPGRPGGQSLDMASWRALACILRELGKRLACICNRLPWTANRGPRPARPPQTLPAAPASAQLPPAASSGPQRHGEGQGREDAKVLQEGEEGEEGRRGARGGSRGRAQSDGAGAHRQAPGR